MEQPFILVLFGATGDLAKNKLIPALFSMFKKNQLPKDFFIYGFARREISDEDFGLFFTEFAGDVQWIEFARHLRYQQGLFDEANGYEALVTKLQTIDKQMGACVTRIFYLATPPSNYDAILDNLVSSKLSEGCGSHFASSFAEASRDKQKTWDNQKSGKELVRIAIEKPFGKDLETAKALDIKLSKTFEERQIFRVDHYLGKETVQNLLVFRFANGIFDPIWNRDYIDHVQIIWSEKQGIKNRGNFFDGVGILRDAAQNHLLQLFAAVAMEMPKSFSKEGVRDVRSQAIKDIICIEPDQVDSRVVRGQYNGYLNEKNVADHSLTETFVAMKFFVNSKRFAQVPFYMRAGKGMDENVVQIHIVFRQTCHVLFREIGCPEEGNVLTIRVQPNEGITMRIIAKTPGSKLLLQPTDMHFNYNEQFGTQGIDAYEKVLTDIITGDQMLFNRSDELQASWTFIEKIIQGWEKSKEPVLSYEVGLDGPEKAQELIEKDGRKWID